MLPHASLGSFGWIWAKALLCIMSRRVNRTQDCVVSTGIICHIQVPYTSMPLCTFYVSLNLSYWLKTMYSNCNSWVAPQRYRPRVRCLGVRKRLAFDTPHPKGRWSYLCDVKVLFSPAMSWEVARAGPCWPPLRPLKRLAWSLAWSFAESAPKLYRQ